MIILFATGQFHELTRRVTSLRREALERGDLLLATDLGVYAEPLSLLALGKQDEARVMVGETLVKWNRSGYDMFHFYAAIALTLIDLYEGNGPEALRRLNEQYSSMRRGMWLQAGLFRIQLRAARAQSALCAAASAKGTNSSFRSGYIRSAERDAKSLDRETSQLARTHAKVARAGIAQLRGDTSGARSILTKAAEEFDALDMAWCADALRRTLGELTRGEAGQALIADSDNRLRERGIVNGKRMTNLVCNGFD